MELSIAHTRKTFFASDGNPIFHLDLPEIKFQFGTVNYIMGHNGSGKSLFLKLLSGELPSDDGEIKMTANGIPASSDDIRVLVVRQRAEDNLCLDLSVEENLLLRLKPQLLKEKLFPKQYLSQSVIQALHGQIDLRRKLTQVSSELSGGQKQTLAFFSAIVQKANVLCLDEFLSSTDFNNTQMLRQKAKQYAEETNSCVIVVSHDFDVALEDAQKIIILNNGKIAYEIERYSPQWNKAALVAMVHFTQTQHVDSAS
jgi:ABC-type uncharacterized transport system ATPase component